MFSGTGTTVKPLKVPLVVLLSAYAFGTIPAGNLSTIVSAYPGISPSLYTVIEYVIIFPFSTTTGSFLCLYVAVPFVSISLATVVTFLVANLSSSFVISFSFPFLSVILVMTFLNAKSNSFCSSISAVTGKFIGSSFGITSTIGCSVAVVDTHNVLLFVLYVPSNSIFTLFVFILDFGIVT